MNYCRPILLLLTFISFWTPISNAASVTMNKCTYSDGRVEFTDQSCSSGAPPSPTENKISSQPIQQNLGLASKLEGTWVIDPKATENFVLSAAPPANASKLAEWFGLAGGYWALLTYEFDGDLATMSAYRGARKLEFQLLSQQGTEIKYTLKNDTSSPAKTLSVSLLKEGNIKIVPSESRESSYVLWKRGTLKTEQATQDDVMAASITWLASLQNIVTFLRKATPQASTKLDELLETEVGIMDATEVVCGPVVPNEVRAGIVKFKGKLSPDELLRMDTIRASSSVYKRYFESASKVLQTAIPTSEGGHKLCASQAVKVGNMPRE